MPISLSWRRRPTVSCRSLLVLGVLWLVLSTAGAALADQQPSESVADDAATETRDQMIEIAYAMMDMITDTVSFTGTSRQFGGTSSSKYCVWGGLPFVPGEASTISHAELESLLVPTYLDALPATDAWGNDYRFELEQPGDEWPLYRWPAIMSPGSDGVYDPETELPGAFTDAPEDDLVWARYWFVRQPQVPANRETAQAIVTMKAVGNALLSWNTDQTSGTGGPPTGPVLTLDPAQRIDHAELVAMLQPTEDFVYTRCLPANDPWGREYDYYVVPGETSDAILAIRTAGADGEVEGESYDRGPVADPAGDLVWASGYFYRYPGPLFASGFESGDTSAWSEP